MTRGDGVEGIWGIIIVIIFTTTTSVVVVVVFFVVVNIILIVYIRSSSISYLPQKTKKQNKIKHMTLTPVCIDTRLLKSKCPRKRFQNFRQSYSWLQLKAMLREAIFPATCNATKYCVASCENRCPCNTPFSQLAIQQEK